MGGDLGTEGLLGTFPHQPSPCVVSALLHSPGVGRCPCWACPILMKTPQGEVGAVEHPSLPLPPISVETTGRWRREPDSCANRTPPLSA